MFSFIFFNNFICEITFISGFFCTYTFNNLLFFSLSLAYLKQNWFCIFFVFKNNWISLVLLSDCYDRTVYINNVFQKIFIYRNFLFYNTIKITIKGISTFYLFSSSLIILLQSVIIMLLLFFWLVREKRSDW